MPQLFKQMVAWWWAVALAILALMFGGNLRQNAFAPRAVEALPGLSADINATSVSGFSSGAYMAGQFQMAHAKLVVGAAIIAGGPYGCSESVFAETMPGPGAEMLNFSKAANGCMLDMLNTWGVGDPGALADKATARASKGEIDPIADVVKDRVYLFSGTSDHIVMPSIVKRAVEFYQKLGVPDGNIKFVNELPAGHAFVTENEGGACGRSAGPYIVNCNYDQAGDVLQHIYGKLNAHSASTDGSFIQFDQRPFQTGQMPDGLSDSGVVYVPQACRKDGACRIHITFHGCAQNQEKVGDDLIKESGFARWADTNKMIILFPQVATTLSNPQACWDWWGYTGHDYLTRNAPQIKAVHAMLEALQHAPSPQS
jgi:hypothetical protein